MKKIVFITFITIISLITIILAISYSVFIYNVSNSDFVNWLDTLISTLISVLFALIIAICIFYYQTNLVKNETKDNFNPLIEMILIDIWKSLSDLRDAIKIRFTDGKELVFHSLIFQNIIFNQAVYANVFNPKQTKFLLRVIAEIDFHNNVIEKLINLSPSFSEEPDKFKKVLEFLNDNHKKIKNNLKKSVLEAGDYFKFNELNKEIKQNT